MLSLGPAARGALGAAAWAAACLPSFGETGANAAASPVAASPAVLAANFPNTDDGRPVTQLGLGVWQYWNYEEPLLDLTRGTPLFWTAKLSNGRMADWRALWAAGLVDKATLYPKALPPGGASIWGGIYRAKAGVLPAAYAGTYVLDWAGDADLRLHWKTCAFAKEMNCQRRISRNRVEATFNSLIKDHSIWEILRIGSGGVRNIRLYRKENEAALNAGKILNPKFQAHARAYKILRFLDPQTAHHARPFRAGDFAKPGQATFAPDIWPAPADAPKQTPFDVLFRVANEADASAWVHVAGLPGAPKSFDALSGDPTGGDVDLWRAACKANMAAILASPDWAAYADEIARGLAASGYPNARMVYIEPWNEVWNYAWPFARMTKCMDGFAEAMGQPAYHSRYAYGYFAAHVMVEVDRALKKAGRTQAWTLALAGQMANEATTKLALDGFAKYFAEKGIDAKPWLKHVGVSTASYYDGSLSREVGFLRAASDAEHLARLKAAIAAGTADKARADWLISGPAAQASTIPFLVAQRRKHQGLAETAGAYFLGDYEGESHELMAPYLKADPKIVNWAETWIQGPQGERVTRAWGEALTLQNPKAVIANYLSIAPLDPEGDAPTDAAIYDPWYDGYYGEANGRTRALGSMLRP